jgi:ATP-binding protein involved in chromosome partitioning
VAADPRTTPRRVEPTEDSKRLRIVWGDGHTSEYVPRTLRLACRCAGCIEETTGRAILDPARVPQGVYPIEIRYVGRYALHFNWSDGHSTGIYPFELLRAICTCEECAAAAEGQG